MGSFKSTILTQKAHALMAKLTAGTAEMSFTKLKSSDHDYSGLTTTQLEALTSIESIKQEVEVSEIKRINDASVKVTATLVNTSLTTGYYIRAIGLYANDPDEGEILYSVTTAIESDWMPPYNSISSASALYELVTTISNAQNVSIDVDPNATVAISTFNEFKESVNSQLSEIVPNTTLWYLQNIDNIRTRAIISVQGFYDIDEDAYGKYRVIMIDGTEAWTTVTVGENSFKVSDKGDIAQNKDLTTGDKKLRYIVKNDKVNVKLLGAKGDGVTDDSQAFQNAVNYIFSINPLGGRLGVPQDKYLISTPINTYTNKNYDFEGNEVSDTSYEKKNGQIPMIVFEGSGVNNTILKSANGNEIIKGYSSIPSAIYDLTIRNLRFLGYNNQGTPLNMNSANGTIKNVLIENVSFNNFDKGIVYTRDDTIAWGEQSRLILRNCRAGNNNIGYEISGDDTDLINCRSEYNLAWGLVIKGGTRVDIQNCKIQYNGSDNGINNGQVKLVGSIKSLTIDKTYFEPANVTSIATKSAFFYVCTDTNINSGSTYLYNFTIKDCFFNGKKIQKLIICQDTSNIFVKNIECYNNRIQYFKLVDNYLFDIPSSISPKGIRVTGSFEQITDSNDVDISTKLKITNNPNVVSNNGNNYNPNLTTPYILSNGGSLQMITGSVSADALQRYFGASWFSVVKNSTGNYTITLTNSNLSTVAGNVNYFPVIVTPFSQTGKILTANVEMVSPTSFKVLMYDETNTAFDGGFNFMLMCSCF